MLATVTPNAPLLLERAQRDFCTATDLADALVRHSGMSFRQAHHVVGGVVREALARGLRADQIRPELVDEVARTVVNRTVDLPETVVQRALDACQAINARTTIGGPAPSEVRRMVHTARQRLAAEEKTHQGRRARVVRAQRRLGAEVWELLRQSR